MKLLIQNLHLVLKYFFIYYFIYTFVYFSYIDEVDFWSRYSSEPEYSYNHNDSVDNHSHSINYKVNPMLNHFSVFTRIQSLITAPCKSYKIIAAIRQIKCWNDS